jgi:hypothetical protein
MAEPVGFEPTEDASNALARFQDEYLNPSQSRFRILDPYRIIA